MDYKKNIKYCGLIRRNVDMKDGIGTCINIKIGDGNKSRLLEFVLRGSCDVTGVTNKDYSVIVFLF